MRMVLWMARKVTQVMANLEATGAVAHYPRAAMTVREAAMTVREAAMTVREAAMTAPARGVALAATKAAVAGLWVAPRVVVGLFERRRTA